jgi:hypothetical protein
MKISVLLAGAALALAAMPAAATTSYLFGFSPSGSQQLIVNGGGGINTTNTGWFTAPGRHDAGNTNYFVGNDGRWEYRDFASFDAPIGAVSAQVALGNDPTRGLFFGAGVTSVTLTLYDVSRQLNANQDYLDPAIYNDLGSGVVYGSVTISGPTSLVVVNLNQAGVDAINAAGLQGQFFEVGGVLTETFGGGVPEPATWALMIGGFGLAGVALRRRKAAFA